MDRGLQMSLLFRGRWCQRNKSSLSSVVTNWWVHRLSRKKWHIWQELMGVLHFSVFFFFNETCLKTHSSRPHGLCGLFKGTKQRNTLRRTEPQNPFFLAGLCWQGRVQHIPSLGSWLLADHITITMTTFISLHSPMSPLFVSCSSQWRSFWSKGHFCVLCCSAPGVDLAQSSHMLWFFNKE